MENKTIGVIVALMVGVIMVGGVLLPVIDDAASDTKVFDNTKDALFEMVQLDENSNYTLIWRSANPDIVNVNGVDTAVGSGSIICSLGEFTIRYMDTSSDKRIQTFGTAQNHSITDATIGGVFTLTVSNGSCNYTITGDEIDTITNTVSITDGYAICPKGAGSFVMKSPDQGAYVFGDSKIVGMGITAIGSAWNVGFSGVGTVNGITVTQYSGGISYTIGDVTIVSDTVNGYNDLHTITSYQFDVTNPSDDTVTHVTYSYFIVPAYVEATKSTAPALGDHAGLVYTIPIVVIVALLAVAVNLVMRKY